MELLTGFGLATAAGLNAYIPLLALGLLSRFTDLVTLPHGWAWLENGWVMTIVAALLVIEIVADKIPALDSINDTVQTFVRPTAGGIVFGSGTAAQTSAVTDPGAFAQSGQWIPVAIGVVTALVVSLTSRRCGLRPMSPPPGWPRRCCPPSRTSPASGWCSWRSWYRCSYWWPCSCWCGRWCGSCVADDAKPRLRPDCPSLTAAMRLHRRRA